MSHADDYLRLTHELLRRRWKEDPLPVDTETDYIGRLDDIWEMMTATEQESCESWLKDSRLHAVVFQDTDPACPCWIARTLGYDFIGESDTKRGAIANLVRGIEAEIGHFALADARGPFQLVPSPPRGFIEWAVGTLIQRLLLKGAKGDDLLLIEHERQPEKWTLYVVDLS
jgi:hypothetical protein